MDLLKVDIKEAGYYGMSAAVKDINFMLYSEQMLGLIGPNGAGKTTILKAIMGLLPKNKSIIDFVGPSRSYSYMPELPILYDRLTL